MDLIITGGIIIRECPHCGGKGFTDSFHEEETPCRVCQRLGLLRVLISDIPVFRCGLPKGIENPKTYPGPFAPDLEGAHPDA